MKETRILERDDGTITIRRIGTSGKWATSTPEMIDPLMQHITAIGTAMDAVTPDEDLALDRAQRQAVAETAAKEAALAEAERMREDKDNAVQALLELSEMLYGDDTETPLPEVPEPEPGVTP